MIKDWFIKASPAPGFSDRQTLLLSADDIKDIRAVKESFTGNIGVIFRSGDEKYPYAAYIYGASPNILKLIRGEIGVLSGKKRLETLQVEREALEKGKIEKEVILEPPPGRAEEIKTRGVAGNWKFEKLAPDESDEEPLRKPIIKYFEDEKKEIVSGEENKAAPIKNPKIIRVIYLCPEGKRELLKQVKNSINKIILEKSINFNFTPAAEIFYKKDEASEEVMRQVTRNPFNFVLSIAPDKQGEAILKELRKKDFILKVITEDNIDKKFRYLNLITDIVLSPGTK